MKRQEMFDIMVKHLAKQGCRATDDYDNCLYRGPNGTKCAVGALIPDELYDPRMDAPEGVSVPSLMEKYPKVGELLGKRNVNFLNDIQGIHDICQAHDWPNMLKDFARAYNLRLGIVDKAFNETSKQTKTTG